MSNFIPKAVQDWYEARREAALSILVEAQKRTDQGEWLAGETEERFVKESTDQWLKENPKP